MTAAVGTTFTIPFTVFDRSMPALSATISRTVTVAYPCAPGQVFCPAQATMCGPEPCALRAQLTSAADPPFAAPGIAVSAGDASATLVTTVGATINVSAICGVQSAFEFAMCGTQTHPSLQHSCNLVAQADARLGTLPRVALSSAAVRCPDSAAATCTACTTAAVQKGACRASYQRFAYQVVDANKKVGDEVTVDVTVARRIASAAVTLQIKVNGSAADSWQVDQQTVAEQLEMSFAELRRSAAPCQLLPAQLVVQTTGVRVTQVGAQMVERAWEVQAQMHIGVLPYVDDSSNGTAPGCLQTVLAATPALANGSWAVGAAAVNASARDCGSAIDQTAIAAEAAVQNTAALALLTEAELVCQA